MTLSASSRAIAVELAAAGTGTRELRHLPFRRLSFRTRKRRANQPPMHRPFVFRGVLLDLVLVLSNGRSFLRMLNWFPRERRLLNRRLFGECFGRGCVLRGVAGQ
jgi:hypothetical protein